MKIKTPDFVIMTVLGLSLAVSYAIQASGHLDPDVAWINYGVGRLLQGDRLYSEIVEINPPFIYGISLPPIWLARTLGWNENSVFVLWVLLIAALSSLASYGILMRDRHRTFDGHFGIALAHVVFLTLLIGESFGQREHFLLLLLAPYVYLCAIRLENKSVPRRSAAFIGLCAALGIALKPHYAMVPLFLEFLVFHQKSKSGYSVIRPETITGLATAVILSAILVSEFPQYISEITPMALRAYLPFYRERTETVWALFSTVLLLVGVYMLSGYRANIAPPYKTMIVAAIACAFAMLLQYRGFPYQMLPALFLLLGATAFRLFSGDRTKSASVAAIGLGTLAVLFWVNSPLAFRADIPETQALSHGKSIAVLSTNIQDGFPWVPVRGLIWTSRFPSLWFMPFVNSVDGAIEQGQEVRETDVILANGLRRQTVDDLIKHEPEYILLQDFTSPLFSTPVDHLAILGKDRRFAAFISDYARTEEIGKYILYTRKPLR